MSIVPVDFIRDESNDDDGAAGSMDVDEETVFNNDQTDHESRWRRLWTPLHLTPSEELTSLSCPPDSPSVQSIASVESLINSQT